MKSRNATVTALIATALLGVSAVFAQAPAATAIPAAAAAVAPNAAAVAAPVAAPVAASKDAPAVKAEKKAAAKSDKANKPGKPFTAQTAKSKECSVKADAQKLHGKARQKFREECKKAA